MHSNIFFRFFLLGVCCLIMGSLFAAPSYAADEKGLYQTLNYVSCAQYNEDRKLPLHTGRNAADEIYVSGWLSAFNYLTPNTYDIVPGHDIVKVLVWLDTYCKDNAGQSVEAGLLQFSSDNYPSRMESYSAPGEVTPDKLKSKKSK